MIAAKRRAWILCGECGHLNLPHVRRCWLCDAQLNVADAATENVPRNTFGLATLFLIVTLSAVCVGVTVHVPGLGILLIILATPALVRTVLLGCEIDAEGYELTASNKIWLFVMSLSVVTIIGIAAIAAFCCVCFPTSFIGFLLADRGANGGITIVYAAWIIGAIVAITVAARLVRVLWPWRG